MEWNTLSGNPFSKITLNKNFKTKKFLYNK